MPIATVTMIATSLGKLLICIVALVDEIAIAVVAQCTCSEPVQQVLVVHPWFQISELCTLRTGPIYRRPHYGSPPLQARYFEHYFTLIGFCIVHRI